MIQLIQRIKKHKIKRISYWKCFGVLIFILLLLWFLRSIFTFWSSITASLSLWIICLVFLPIIGNGLGLIKLGRKRKGLHLLKDLSMMELCSFYLGSMSMFMNSNYIILRDHNKCNSRPADQHSHYPKYQFQPQQSHPLIS